MFLQSSSIRERHALVDMPGGLYRRGAVLRKEVAEVSATMSSNNVQVGSTYAMWAGHFRRVSAYLKHGLPRDLTLAYMLIPRRTRMLWSMGSVVGSADALIEIEGGGSWAAFLRYNYGWRILPRHLISRLLGLSPGRGSWKLEDP